MLKCPPLTFSELFDEYKIKSVPLNDIFNMMFGANPFSMPGTMPGSMPGSRIHIFNGGPIKFQQALNKPIPIMKSIVITTNYNKDGNDVSSQKYSDDSNDNDKHETTKDTDCNTTNNNDDNNKK